MAILTNCESCGEKIRIEKFDTARSGDIEKLYFSCESCGHEHVIYYTDSEIRRLQAEIREVDAFVKPLKPGTAEWDRQFKAATRKHEKLRREIAAKMAALREKMGNLDKGAIKDGV